MLGWSVFVDVGGSSIARPLIPFIANIDNFNWEVIATQVSKEVSVRQECLWNFGRKMA